jgi:hypothetical protein
MSVNFALAIFSLGTVVLSLTQLRLPHHHDLLPPGLLHLGTQNLPLPCRWHQLSLV